MTTAGETPPPFPVPTQTLVVGQDGQVLLVIDGPLVLPIGSQIQLAPDGVDVSVVGIRLVRSNTESPQLLLEVDAGGSSFSAAIREADAEAQVVEAAEDITSGAPDAEDAVDAPLGG